MSLSQLSTTKQQIVGLLKRQGPRTITEVAESTGLSTEAVRRHFAELSAAGWIHGKSARAKKLASTGRPSTRFGLTTAGEHLFPKAYDALFIGLFDTMVETLGAETAQTLLAEFSEARVSAFKERTADLSLADKLEKLKHLYSPDDTYVEVEQDEFGYKLTEYNCPFLNVALKRPQICASSVHLLSRILGVAVIREQRFQAGHGRCVFRILADRPRTDSDFQPE